MQLLLDMTRRSLQLIALWICIIVPNLMFLADNQTDLVKTRTLWLGVIFPVMYFALGLIRQHYDRQNIK